MIQSQIHQAKKDEKSISYYNHFRKVFMRPYGLAHDETSYDHATLGRRLNNVTCEFYLQARNSNVCCQFAETILTNVQYLEQNIEIVDQRWLAAFISKTKKIEKYLNILDTKQTNEKGTYIYIQRYTHIYLSIYLSVSLYISILYLSFKLQLFSTF